MTGEHATSERVVDLRRRESQTSSHPTALLLKNHNVEILRLFLPAGTSIPSYQAAGDVILQCLSGHISLRAGPGSHDLLDGQLVYVDQNEPLSIRAREDTHLLATLLAPREGPHVKLIGEQDDD